MSLLPEDIQSLFAEEDVNPLVVTDINFNKMTKREFELATLIGLGCPNKEIANRLGIKLGTVKVYMSKLFEKLCVKSRLELAEIVNDGCEEFISAKLLLDEKLETRRLKHSK
jgi:DNA-binding NarL/FixJ family response regulator